MNAEQMADTIAFLDAIAPDAADRVRNAGLSGVLFAWTKIPGQRRTQGGINAAALASCELQCVVEAFHAEKAGGVFIGRRAA